MPYTNKKDLYKAQVARWIRIKKKAVAYKGGCCESCGYDRHYAAMQFHHKVPEQKKYVWTKLRLRKWSDIEEELDKCQLLCANCHSILHSNEPLSS